jgi:hypothetical protein
VSAKELDALLLEFVKTEHRGEYETLTTIVTETSSDAMIDKEKCFHYLEVCEHRHIGPEDRNKNGEQCFV